VILMRLTAAVPLMPAETGVIEMRHLPGVRNRITQRAVAPLAPEGVLTAQKPRTVRPARHASLRDGRCALIRYLVSRAASNVATSRAVVTRRFDHLMPVGAAGAVAPASAVPVPAAAVGVTAFDAADDGDEPLALAAVATKV